MPIDNVVLAQIKNLIETWESLAVSARKKATEQEIANYTAGYGYGMADGIEYAVKTLQSLINSFVNETKDYGQN
jgi:hypothetical protein